MGSCFGSHPGTSIGALRLALLAALGVVFEILIVEEELLACGEDEFGAAVNTLEYLVREFHGRLPRSREPAEIGHDLRCAGPVSLSSYVVQQLGPGPRLRIGGFLNLSPEIREDQIKLHCRTTMRNYRGSRMSCAGRFFF